jgi:hypothetical protein
MSNVEQGMSNFEEFFHFCGSNFLVRYSTFAFGLENQFKLALMGQRPRNRIAANKGLKARSRLGLETASETRAHMRFTF